MLGEAFESRMSAALDALIEAPFAAKGWDAALTATADLIGAECADMSFIDPRASGPQLFFRLETARIDVPLVQRYVRDFMSDPLSSNPRVPQCLRLQQGELFTDNDLWPERDRFRQPFFAELMRPLGLQDAVMGMARKSDDEGQPWILLAGHFSKDHVLDAGMRGQFRNLLQHYRRSVEVEERLLKGFQKNTELVEALDHVKEAVAILDGSGKVKHANQSALQIFRAATGISLGSSDCIRLTCSEARSSLAKALSQCCDPATWISAGDVSPPVQIVVRRADKSPLVLTLQRLSRNQWNSFDAVALMFISDPAARPANRASILRSTYGLSPSEARLMQALSEGESLKEIACRHNITYETVRTSLRRVMEKTGARRQADLVRIIHRLR